jgi:hypothetical protein
VDADRQATLRRQLTKMMERDGSFAHDLSALLREAAAAKNIVNAGDQAKIVQQVGSGNVANIR